MRDPDSEARVRRPFEICEALPGLGATSSRFVGQDTERGFARGTRADHRAGPPPGVSDPAALDLTAFPCASLVLDADGRIVDANPLAEQLFGHARSDLVGEPVDLVASKLLSGEQLGRTRFLSATAGRCVRHRSGRAIPVEVLLCPHDKRWTVAMFRPVETTAAGLREEDVAQIVHDLKNPLSTIALEAYLL